MRLENLVWDARDPHRLGRFWAVALDAEPITDEPDGFEPRMTLAEDVFLDLCFQRARGAVHLAGAPSPRPQGRCATAGGG